MSEEFDEAYWDNRYSGGRHWSGNPNATLVAAVSSLTPGTALDVGAGEGGDAIWLARQGWTVTALDISGNALRLAAAHTDEVAPEVASRISWVHADLSVPGPSQGMFDLVTAHYIHLPPLARDTLLRAMVAAVLPGGTLVVVAHHPSDLEVVPRPPIPELFYLGDDVVALLGEGWEVLTQEDRARTVEHPPGTEVTIHDMIVVARRLPG